MITRRSFVRYGTASVITFAGFPALSLVSASATRARFVLVQLRGGMDSLTAVPPIGDKWLESARPNTWIKNSLALDSHFALHPALGTLHELWKRDQLAVIHAVGLPYTGRSHFDGQNLMEGGGKTPYAMETGWLGRSMNAAGLKGLALALPIPLVLRGIEDNDNYFPAITRVQPTKGTYRALIESWAGDRAVRGALEEVIDRPVQNFAPQMTFREREQVRNNRNLAAEAAQQLRKPDGPRVALFDFAGFDTHAAQGGDQGFHADKLHELDDIIRVLQQGLGKVWNDTLVVTATEFGRTVAENGSAGTDHGWGSCQFIAGGLIKKAQVLADWPGLKSSQLFEGRDLRVTTDMRAVFAAAVDRAFALDHATVKTKIFADDSLADLSATLFRT
jgi:uncharacterized protein (DUF1501 family)